VKRLTSTTLTDEELLRLAVADRHGETGRHAASTLLERYWERVYIWCLRSARDHDRALDLAQETLLLAYRRLDTFEGRSSLGSWLFVITRNCCCSALRRPSPTWEEEDRLESIPDPAPDPAELLERKIEEEELLDLARQHLEPIEQEAIWLRCYEGLPVDEITRLLEVESPSGARGLLQRARRKLRAALESREGSTRSAGGVRP
jgi:RNA polymerase sigma-70 factor (ECF subfamily)